MYVYQTTSLIGKILDDSSVISDHGIDEKKFIVIMVTKPKVTEPATKTPADPTAQAAAAPAPTPAPAPAATPSPAAAPATTPVAAPTEETPARS